MIELQLGILSCVLVGLLTWVCCMLADIARVIREGFEKVAKAIADKE